MRIPLRALLPLAALLLLALWARGAAPFVAWEVALDHRKCFRHETLPAKVWSSDPAVIASWFESRGTELPLIPAGAAGLELVGGRYCPLIDVSQVAHLYYEGGDRRLSLFVIPRRLRGDARWSGEAAGKAVRALRAGGTQVALVGDTQADVAAFERALSTRVARSPTPGAP